jgi:uncharacterized protein YlxW (UPF0749 family)
VAESQEKVPQDKVPQDKVPQDKVLPPQATMGLLDYITAHSLDEDYAHVAEKRAPRTDAEGPGRSRDLHVASVVALLLFGLLVTTAGIQTARSEPARQSSRDSLVAQAQERRAELDEVRQDVLRLRREVARAQSAGLAASETGRATRAELATLGVVTGAAAATGPGVRIVVDDNPEAATGRQVVYDTDLQILVNGLWNAGAEAVSINGQRVTNLTSIRVAGEAITVNLRSLSRPYTVLALGDPDQLPARFVESPAGTWWLNLRSVYGLQFTMTREESLTVPAAPPLSLRHARRPGTGR